MSSSQPPSKDNNSSNRHNQLADYDVDEPAQAQHDHPDRDFHQPENEQMYSYPDDDVDEDFPHDNVVHQYHSRQPNTVDDDDLIYSDAVQDAFKKYQNEQEEMFAQMEECWNYMNQESDLAAMPNTTVRLSNQSQLNPDAIEFQPTWTTSTSTATNVHQGSAPSNRSDGVRGTKK